MFETLGNHAEGKGLDTSDGLVPSPTVAKDAGQVWDLGDPAAIFLTFDLDAEGQAHAMYCSTAGALPNALHPTVASNVRRAGG